MTRHELSHQTSEVLEPELTAFDKRVLAALDQWTEDRHLIPVDDRPPLEWRTIWDIGERLRLYDLAELRRVLDGLARFGHADVQGWDHRRRWIATPWKASIYRAEGAARLLEAQGHPEAADALRNARDEHGKERP